MVPPAAGSCATTGRIQRFPCLQRIVLQWPGKNRGARLASAGDLRANCVPDALLDGAIPDYDSFLEQRRALMALKIKTWFHAL